MKLVLKDNSEIELIQYTSNAFVVLCADEEAFYSIWGKMTPENLSRVHIDDNGTTALILENIIFDGIQATYNNNRSITGYIYFHGQEYVLNEVSEQDREYIEAGKILLGEE